MQLKFVGAMVFEFCFERVKCEFCKRGFHDEAEDGPFSCLVVQHRQGGMSSSANGKIVLLHKFSDGYFKRLSLLGK